MKYDRSAKKTFQRYIIGYGSSLLFTFSSFGLVWWYTAGSQTISKEMVIGILFVFAISQLVVQLFFFLHVGHESKPRWNLFSLLFMLLILIIIVAGSLWIMANLDYHMMSSSPQEMDARMLEESKGGF